MRGEKEKDDGSARGAAVGDVRSGRDCGGRYSAAVPATCCFPVDFSQYSKAKREGGEKGRIATATWAFLFHGLEPAVNLPLGPAKC